MLPLHPWYPTQSNCARDTQKQAGGVVPCRHPTRSSCAWDTPMCSPLQAGPPHATAPAARAGRTFHRMPSQSAHRYRRALGPPTGADRAARRQPRDSHTGASSALVPVPPRPSCRYPLDPPHTDKAISPGMKHSHPRERTLDEGPLQFEPSVRAAPSLRLSRTDGRRPTAPDGRFALPITLPTRTTARSLPWIHSNFNLRTAANVRLQIGITAQKSSRRSITTSEQSCPTTRTPRCSHP